MGLAAHMRVLFVLYVEQKKLPVVYSFSRRVYSLRCKVSIRATCVLRCALSSFLVVAFGLQFMSQQLPLLSLTPYSAGSVPPNMSQHSVPNFSHYRSPLSSHKTHFSVLHRQIARGFAASADGLTFKVKSTYNLSEQVRK